MQTHRVNVRRTGLLQGGLLLLLHFGICGVAFATEPRDVSAPVTGASAELPAVVDPAPMAREVAGIGRPIDAGALGELRGGDHSVQNDIRVDGEVAGNSAEHVVSGTNIIDGAAFGNAVGVSTVIQNSGSNVLIQNAMIVNVQFGSPDP